MQIKAKTYELGGHVVTPRTAPVSSLTGVVLAGGKSSRMGKDKASLYIGRPLPSGETGPALAFRMADVLGEALHAHDAAAEVWISCQPERVIPPTHAHLGRVHDTVHDAGPLAGIAATLEAAKGPIFVLACDMPLMQSNVLQLLIDARQIALADSARAHPLLMTTFHVPQDASLNSFQKSTKDFGNALNIEPLVAIYEYAALPHLQHALQKKHFSLRRIIDREALCVVPCAVTQKAFFFNMNNPEELYEATQLLLRQNMEA